MLDIASGSPGGSFSIATCDAGRKNILTYAIGSAAASLIPPAVVSAVQRFEYLPIPRLLRRAGSGSGC